MRVLATVGGEPSALVAKAATWTIPIIFAMGNPVQAGLVDSYARPRGNITGIDIMSPDLEAKRIGLLHDLVPQATTIGCLLNPGIQVANAQQRSVEEAAHALKLEALVLGASSDGESKKDFDTTGPSSSRCVSASPLGWWSSVTSSRV